MRRFDPPWEYLRTASISNLGQYELSRLNHAANLRKEMATLLDEWLEESVAALLARWLIEHQNLLHPTVVDPARDVASLAAQLFDSIHILCDKRTSCHEALRKTHRQLPPLPLCCLLSFRMNIAYTNLTMDENAFAIAESKDNIRGQLL